MRMTKSFLTLALGLIVTACGAEPSQTSEQQGIFDFLGGTGRIIEPKKEVGITLNTPTAIGCFGSHIQQIGNHSILVPDYQDDCIVDYGGGRREFMRQTYVYKWGTGKAFDGKDTQDVKIQHTVGDKCLTYRNLGNTANLSWDKCLPQDKEGKKHQSQIWHIYKEGRGNYRIFSTFEFFAKKPGAQYRCLELDGRQPNQWEKLVSALPCSERSYTWNFRYTK